MTGSPFAAVARDVARDHGWPETTTPSELLERWEFLVESCEDGYSGGIYEHSNDLSARDVLEAILTDARTASASEAHDLRQEVERLDDRYRALLQDGVTIRDTSAPWWRRGVLRSAGSEYVDDLDRLYGIHVEPE